MWTVTNGPPKLQRKGDPDNYEEINLDISSIMEKKPVDVLLYGGAYPSKASSLWRNEELKAIIWIVSRRASGSPRVPKRWSCSIKRITHSNVGGVTDGRFWVHVAVRDGGTLSWKPRHRFVNNTLNQIVDPNISGKKCCPVKSTEIDKSNTSLGVLTW
eukprot:CAMPEP_0195294542 /NCGR_PEP_ID=MMETSP0707-20130614/15272_1 /TAXON_ID=33640 /ORGANISM="Asterionellopsis glacialis, Strain CCMP134" /LENGTH=157 /DNA_ID=CAMNT_0040355543 /DNA_START=1966 /DNA_END=2436 /DNA_ORIENTATION=-